MKSSFQSIKKRSQPSSPSVETTKKMRMSSPPGAPRKPVPATKIAETDTPKWRLAKAMSTYRRYSPGLGHDGDGLYGALTNNSLRHLMEEINVGGCRVVDIGAADGKVLLAALACGAKMAHGVEVAGDALENKFDSMIRELRRDGVLSEEQPARLKCKVNVARLPDGCGDNVEGMLSHYFPEDYASVFGKKKTGAKSSSSNGKLVVIAVWHGFNVEAKQALLRCLCESRIVEKFVVVGPQNFPYGKSDEILEFLRDEKCKWKPRSLKDLVVKLSGGGETYRATVIGK
jgi:hypothetical protein